MEPTLSSEVDSTDSEDSDDVSVLCKDHTCLINQMHMLFHLTDNWVAQTVFCVFNLPDSTRSPQSSAAEMHGRARRCVKVIQVCLRLGQEGRIAIPGVGLSHFQLIGKQSKPAEETRKRRTTVYLITLQGCQNNNYHVLTLTHQVPVLLGGLGGSAVA